ncbi:small multi-drug export protein [Bacillaceae bacterium IKA-2]|nr:small multi-drug export protein [Bacillaceae bacterium IKA-2]
MDFLVTSWEYILVFLIAAIPVVEIAVVIPVALVKGLNPILVGIFAFLGNLATVYLLIVFFEKYQLWREKRRRKPKKRSKRAVEIWNKYGLPGLSISAPILIGSHIAVIIALAFGAKKILTIFWMTISLGLWAIAFTIGSYYGVEWLIG